jgi:hypothetical protein
VQGGGAAERQIGEIGGAGEHVRATGQPEALAVALDDDAALQGDDDDLVRTGVQGVRTVRRQVEHAEAGVTPAGRLGGHLEGIGPSRRGAGGQVQGLGGRGHLLLLG